MFINNKVKQALWQNWWKPDKIERKLTNKRLYIFSDKIKTDRMLKNKKKRKKMELEMWSMVVICLWDILKPKINFFNENKPPLSAVYLLVEITNKRYNKAWKVKYVWKIIDVVDYDYWFNKAKKEDIEKMNKWIEKNLSWEIVFKNIQIKKTKEIVW